MRTSQVGIDLIRHFEGVSLTPYLCPAGVLTIGYGHTGPDVTPDSRIQESHAEVLLKQDLKKFETAILKLVEIPLNQNQFDALVSFCFNIGSGAFASSTLLKRLNAGENANNVIKEELPRWNKGDNNQVLLGLTRRRSAEIELFLKEPPEPKMGTVDITARQQTWLKKSTESADKLSNDQKAKIVRSRVIRNCKVLDRKDKHTYLEMGFGLGKWWIFDAHWDGLTTATPILPYAVDGDMRYLRDFPYFYQRDNGPEGWRQCQTSSIAMCLRYLDVPGIKDDLDYLKIVNKYGDTTRRPPHYDALKELNVYAKFNVTTDAQDVKDQIDKGLPVAAGVLHHGTVTKPTGGGHFVVITGYSKTHWLVQDPYGELDLFNGGWAQLSSVAGRNVKYSFKNLNPRIFIGGPSDGWCWLDFKKL